ncbi:MAG: AN1-type zinc finger domain-containing protein [archaeon]
MITNLQRCAVCGKEVRMPFTCKYCGLRYCDKHRLPERHECTSLPKRQFFKDKQNTKHRSHYHKPRNRYYRKHNRRINVRINFKSFKIWAIVYLLALVGFSYFESTIITTSYFQIIYNIMVIFTIAVAVWSIIKLIKKCDYSVHSSLGIFGLKILSGVMIGVGFVLIYFIVFAGFMAIIYATNTATFDLLSLFFSIFSFGLLLAGAYLMFRFQRKSGIIVYNR